MQFNCLVLGQVYTAAAGEEITNDGEETLNLVTEENVASSVTYQIANISKPLTAVGDICDKDCLVIFGKNGGFIQNRAGDLTKFDRRNGIYILKMWLSMDDNKDTSFQRQGPHQLIGMMLERAL